MTVRPRRKEKSHDHRRHRSQRPARPPRRPPARGYRRRRHRPRPRPGQGRRPRRRRCARPTTTGRRRLRRPSPASTRCCSISGSEVGSAPAPAPGRHRRGQGRRRALDRLHQPPARRPLADLARRRAPRHRGGRWRPPGMPHTLLRNGWYLENYTARLAGALAQARSSAAAGEGRISAAPRADYAAAAAAVLTGDGHAGKTYELAADEAFTLAGLAARDLPPGGPGHPLPQPSGGRLRRGARRLRAAGAGGARLCRLRHRRRGRGAPRRQRPALAPHRPADRLPRGGGRRGVGLRRSSLSARRGRTRRPAGPGRRR